MVLFFTRFLFSTGGCHRHRFATVDTRPLITSLWAKGAVFFGPNNMNACGCCIAVGFDALFGAIIVRQKFYTSR
jgi:hypothetical protein